ncbi:MAG TPA: ElyC/SanA/YdcF family protein [Acidimicrobiales bacterium]|nr:ElyC/SanA/YdcF family protein [Acidimicrobiales bacterium]
MLLFAPIRWALKLLYFAVLAAVVYVVVTGFQVVTASHLPTTTASLRPARSIVVLGAPLVDGAPGPVLLARLEQALTLYEAKLAPQVIVTGAPAQPATATTPAVASVTRIATSWLESNGVPTSSILGLPAAGAPAGVAAAAGVAGSGTHVIVVTDAIDALWAKGAASRSGLVAQVSPAVGSERSITSELGPLWRQATAVAVGRLIGYGRTTWVGD